ncbi:MAG: hypothetical protein JXQ87_10795 [Bacteroidia bacterium]
MIRLFNHSHPSVYLALLALAALCFGVIPFYPEPLPYNFSGPNHVAMVSLLQYKWLVYVLVVIIGFFNSVILNSLFIERQSSSRSSHLPAALFILVSAIASPVGYMLHNQFMILFFLTAVFFIQQLESSTNEVNSSFFIGLFIALGSVFNPFVLLLIFWALWRSINTRYSLSRVLFLMLIGYIITLYLIWTGNFLFNNGQVFIDSYFSIFSLKMADFNVAFIDKLSYGFFGIMALISILATLSSEAYKSVQSRSWLQLWISIGFTFAAVAIVFDTHQSAFQIAAIPIAGLLCFSILGKKRKILRQLLFYVWVLALILDHANTLHLVDLQKSIF